VVDGQVRPLGSDLLAHRYAVDGNADLAYRIPASAMLRALLLLLVLALVPFAFLRVYASRVSRQDIDATDKAHRLRASLLVIGLVLPLGLLAVLFLGGFLLLPDVLLGGLAPGLSRLPVVQAAASMLFLLAVFLMTLLPAVGTVAPYYRKLRGIEATRASRIGNLRLSLAFLLPMLLWVLLLNLLPATGLTPRGPSGAPGAWMGRHHRRCAAACRPADADPAPGGAAAAPPGRPACARRGARPRDPRARHPIAEGGQCARHGPPPLPAVRAGNRLSVGSHLLQGVSPGVVLLAIPVLLLLGLVLIQGGLGLVLERKADEYAARQVGVDPTIRALEKMAEANLLKRRTGPLWNLLTHHPGVAQRVERLQAEQRRMPLSHTAPKGSGP
jgi:hypothetical protein